MKRMARIPADKLLIGGGLVVKWHPFVAAARWERLMSVYRFGPFEARTHTEELYKFGIKVALRGQPFQILRALLDRPGEIVTREEMREQLWPSDTFVDFEHGINASLRKLRITLGDSAVKPLYVETLPGQGYRFIAPFEVIEETPALASAAQPETDTIIEEETAHAPVEAHTGAAWRRGMLLGLAVGAVVFGLLFFATRSRRIVDAAAPKVHEGLAPSTPTAADPDPSLPVAATANGKNFPLRARATEALSPNFGKVWVVSLAQADRVTFPPPNVPPDATFITRGIGFIGRAPNRCYTLGAFLTGCGNVFNLEFSGKPNPNLGGKPAGADTAMSGDTWGVLIEFKGSVNLAHGQEIAVLHDDGVALEIDGKQIPGFSSWPTVPAFDVANFAGPSGVHSFDLLYANATEGGAWLLFYPALF